MYPVSTPKEGEKEKGRKEERGKMRNRKQRKHSISIMLHAAIGTNPQDRMQWVYEARNKGRHA